MRLPASRSQTITEIVESNAKMRLVHAAYAKIVCATSDEAGRRGGASFGGHALARPARQVAIVFIAKAWQSVVDC
jgi:hypothetical protein